jgi:transcriptional regulator with XRE-family HTH domain
MDRMTTSDALPTDQYVRRVRRVVDASQRELAELAGVSERTIARIESGAVVPSLRVLQRLLAAAGYHLVVVDADHQLVSPMRDLPEGERDRQGRRFPAHLDVIVDPGPGEWWGDLMGIARPPETFRRSRSQRDRQRARYVKHQQLYGRA